MAAPLLPIGGRRGPRGAPVPIQPRRQRGQQQQGQQQPQLARRPAESIEQKIQSLTNGIGSIERLRYTEDFIDLVDKVLRTFNPGGIDELRTGAAAAAAGPPVRAFGVKPIPDLPGGVIADEDITAATTHGIQSLVVRAGAVAASTMDERKVFCGQVKDVLRYGLGEFREDAAIQALLDKIKVAQTESQKIISLEKELPDIEDKLQKAITAISTFGAAQAPFQTEAQAALNDMTRVKLDAAIAAAVPTANAAEQTAIDNLTRALEKAKLVVIEPGNIEKFKTLSDEIETAAARMERIEKAIVSTSDIQDYADGSDFYQVVQKLYEQRFQISSLISDTKYLLSEKIEAPKPRRGGALTQDQIRERATSEKAAKLREDAQVKLRDLQLKDESIQRQINNVNTKLANAVTYDERRIADKELGELFKQTEETIKGVQDVQKELESSRTDQWFDIVESKTENYVEFANSLYEARKKRLEAEIKQKEETARFATANAIKLLMDNCLKDLKGVSTKKCDRINSLREIYTTAKDIEAKKSELVQNAALMLNPSRGTAQYTDGLNDGQRIKRFEDLEKTLTAEYTNSMKVTYPDVASASNPKSRFRQDYANFARLLREVSKSAAFYGPNQDSPDNTDLASLRENMAEYDRKAGEEVGSPNYIANNVLYNTHFEASYKFAMNVLKKQKLLLDLTTRGGELVRQKIDATKRETDDATTKLMEDYENLKSLPTEIGKSEENVKKCFNEGFDKSKKEKESALKDEITSIRATRDSELKTIEAEYKSNLTKLKSEIKESKGREGRKEYKDMNSQELDAEYQRVLAEVQRLDDRLRENRREDSDKIPGLRNQLDGFRSKLAEIGRIRKAASGGNRYHHRTIRKIR